MSEPDAPPKPMEIGLEILSMLSDAIEAVGKQIIDALTPDDVTVEDS